MTKHLHSENSGASWLQNIVSRYNERGWLDTLASPLLSLNLKYNYGSSPQFNGNIVEMQYSASHSSQTFDYGYDPLNRLLTSNAGSSSPLNETITYDDLGNIGSLVRGTTTPSNMIYHYTDGGGNLTNQLQSVTISSATFRTYDYDGNGNATGDGGASSPKTINYNILNLPKSLTQSGSSIATYIYDAAGTKLRSTSVADSTWDYVSGIVYRNNSIAYIQTEDGRAIKEGTNYAYQYDLKDHLGNNRVVFDKNPTSGAARELQEDEYYAFGLRQNLFGSGNSNRYLYNGKEIQADLTNQYDYGARFYDPVIGRWYTPDPLAEISRRWSPYNYAENNPVRNIDPDGMITITGGYGESEEVGVGDHWSADGDITINGQTYSNSALQAIHPEIAQAISDGVNKTNDQEENPKSGHKSTIKLLIAAPDVGKDVGHTAIQIGDSVYGYYPGDDNNNNVYDKSELVVSNAVLEVEPRKIFDKTYLPQGFTEITLAVDETQIKQIKNYLLNIKADPGSYSLLAKQCTSIAASALAAGGIQITIPSKYGRVPIGTLLLAPAALKSVIESYNRNLIIGREKFYQYQK